MSGEGTPGDQLSDYWDSSCWLRPGREGGREGRTEGGREGGRAASFDMRNTKQVCNLTCMSGSFFFPLFLSVTADEWKKFTEVSWQLLSSSTPRDIRWAWCRWGQNETLSIWISFP